MVPEDLGDFDRILPKEEETLSIVRRKIASGERVLIYTSWTRTDSQQKLLKLQAKAMKLMASKLAVAGIIEGTFSEEGLAAMSDVKDMTSQMTKELALGIKDNVEDIAAAFKKMAVINPDRQCAKPAQPQNTKPALQKDLDPEAQLADDHSIRPAHGFCRTGQLSAGCSAGRVEKGRWFVAAKQ